MLIDDRIEDLVRQALNAVIRRSLPLLEQAIHVFGDDPSRTEGSRLACAIASFAAHERHGRTPTPAEIDAFATDVSDRERWSGVTAVEVRALLTVVTGHAGRDGINQLLPPHRVALVCYVTAGSLLVDARDGDEAWWEALDRVEAGIEAMM
ncbi:hypothetical protein GCM10010124_35860 [Pilimelia terevasa]|uniref:Uncharacterized protein n=1 Tax=Pilimelia terevasa TaxID=53372 RepID=A0A8J3FJT5_9ACTN|nr:hypothetical protein [Pilimelia terevasa]GGK40003.1 hypothetical protein GCM10010124_35860 [Pilimelia terevasa]